MHSLLSRLGNSSVSKDKKKNISLASLTSFLDHVEVLTAERSDWTGHREKIHPVPLQHTLREPQFPVWSIATGVNTSLCCALKTIVYSPGSDEPPAFFKAQDLQTRSNCVRESSIVTCSALVSFFKDQVDRLMDSATCDQLGPHTQHTGRLGRATRMNVNSTAQTWN